MLVVEHRRAPTPTYTHVARSPSPSNLPQTPRSLRTFVDTPPVSPSEHKKQLYSSSSLYPADAYAEIIPHVRLISAAELSTASEQQAKTPLPSSESVFPWFHGLKETNMDQRLFLCQATTGAIEPPCSYRGIALVAVNASSTGMNGSLVGSLTSDQLFKTTGTALSFVDPDPAQGVSLRNFNIQAVKSAMLSDIVIYDVNHAAGSDETLLFASQVADAQRQFHADHKSILPEYNTFILSTPFSIVEQDFPHLVAHNLAGVDTGNDTDFVEQERQQMRNMSSASELAPRIDLGNAHCWQQDVELGVSGQSKYAIHVKCEDYVSVPGIDSLPEHLGSDATELCFPASGCLSNPAQNEVDDVVDFCSWLWQITSSAAEANHLQRRILISCRDGYTETSLLSICYLIYFHCLTVEEAWVRLHVTHKRNFYAFPEDVATVQSMFPKLIEASPHEASAKERALNTPNASWLTGHAGLLPFTGNFPSRILEHLYLGNLDHANRVDMLRALNITRVLSMGERPAWMSTSSHAERPEACKFIPYIQDDGVDSILDCLEKCLEFIDEGARKGQITLVHCRVGVSRSATICIADVVRRLGLQLPEAYLLVRARRLNVIIQPNLKFMYELHKWSQEELSRQQENPIKTMVPRLIEWPQLATKISALNQLYIQRP